MRIARIPVLALVVMAFWNCNFVVGVGNYTTGDGGGGDDAVTCAGSQVSCDGVCVNLASDDQHCGGCEKSCAAALRCFGGQCCSAPPGGGTCDVYPQCGCSEEQNCARIDGGPEECVSNGSGAQLATCTSTTDCAHGLVCTEEDVCDPPCGGSCQTNYVCFEQYSGTVDLSFKACVPHCNPLQPSLADTAHVACGAGERCDLLGQIVPADQGDTFCDSPSSSGGQGAGCIPKLGVADQPCAPGYDCTKLTATATTGTCEKFCRVGAADCTSGLTCTSFATPQYDGSTEIGVCH